VALKLQAHQRASLVVRRELAVRRRKNFLLNVIAMVGRAFRERVFSSLSPATIGLSSAGTPNAIGENGTSS
jgi:hypothetical protein